jgi:hypothetical protein
MKTAAIAIILIITGAIIMLVGGIVRPVLFGSKSMPVSRGFAITIGLVILIAGIIWYIIG